MMTPGNTLKVFILAALCALPGQQAAAGELSANLGILSTYISRGINLSTDKLSLSPGIHYQGDNGVYTGFQAYTEGNIDPYFEIDGYLGYDKQFDNGFGLNARVLSYQFPYADQFPDHFEEVTLTGRYGNDKGTIEASANRFMNSIVKGDTYVSVTGTKPLSKNVSISGTAGHYEYADDHKIDPFTGENLNYNNYTLAATWKEWTAAVEYNDNKLYEVDPKYTLTWKKYFGF